MEDMDENFTLSGDINGPLLAAVISIEMIGGLIANSFVLILTICHIKTWKQPSTIFLTNMLISNILIVLFVMPFAITTAASDEWLFGKTYKQKMKVCQFTAFMFWFCKIVITEGLVLLSFDRFFYIVKSFEYERHMNQKISIIIVTLSWLLAALLTIPPLFGLGRFSFSSSNGICVPHWEGESGYVVYMLIVFIIFIISLHN
uniref:G-protein coupled receptors family 1 profile domain-containing protein n=2 Tax=Amphimedon queenslandica TaxID=400682 RepID=A0A1X7SHE5_AMPQE